MSDAANRTDSPLVLVVDDEEAIRTLLVGTLEGGGFRALSVADGPAAVNACRERRPDLVVLDLVMPDVDGFETCRRLRLRPEMAHTPVLALAEDPASITPALEAGVSDILLKPGQMELLCMRLHCLLKLSATIRSFAEREAYCARALSMAGLGYWEWNPVTDAFWWSDGAAHAFMLDHSCHPSYQGFLGAVYAPDRTMVDAAFKEAVRQRSSASIELRIKRPDGTLATVNLKGEATCSGDATLPRLFGIMQEVNDQRQPDDRLTLLKEAIDSLPLGITISDTCGRIIYTNPAEAEMHGLAMSEILSRQARQLAPSRLGRKLPPGGLNDLNVWRRESVNLRADGEEFPVQLSSITVRSTDGKCLGIVTACEDISQRKETEERIQRLAYYDPLTGLPNRLMFLDRLQQALALAEREQRQAGLLFLDLDNFKDTNDTLGHDFGDRLLREIAARLDGCMRGSDTLARLGGDEFVVLLTSIAGQESVASAASRIISVFDEPVVIDGHQVHAATSIGVALYPGDSGDAEGLLKCADTAMYQAKSDDKGNFRFFSPEMNERVLRRVTMENGLRLGLEREEFFLEYQPRWQVGTGRFSGVEALLRWRSRDLGLLMPGEFIPLAEKTGTMPAIGEWALRSACHQGRCWIDSGLEDFRIAANISRLQLHRPGFVALVDRILHETGLSPCSLELEFTENCLMEHAEMAVQTLTELRELGIGLTVDDFGTGLSTLSHLCRFPIDRMKIDHAGLGGIDGLGGNGAVITAVISMAGTLGIAVVAEGVETAEQMQFYAERGCEAIQGFYLAPPQSAGQLTAALFPSQASPAVVMKGDVVRAIRGPASWQQGGAASDEL
jgi:diguanylate cyclase (GGDEF)-like protein/PAS domain S-box-containing protein